MADSSVSILDSGGVARAVDAQTVGTDFQQTVTIGDGTNAGRVASIDSSGRLSVLNNDPDVTASGTISATDAVVAAPGGAGVLLTGTSTTNSYVACASNGGDSAWAIQLTGTFGGGTVYFEESADSTNGTNGSWIAVNARQSGIVNSSVAFSTTVAGLYRGNTSGVAYVRARIVGATAPSVAVVIRISGGVGAIFLNSSIPAGSNVLGSTYIADGTTPSQKVKVDAGGALAQVPQAVILTGTSTTYSTAMTISLGSLTPVAGGDLPDFGSVELFIVNGTNQTAQSSPQLIFTGDAFNGQTPALPGSLYNAFMNTVAAGTTGVQKIALVGGILRNVSVSIPFSVAPTTGTLGVYAVFHPQRSGTYITDPSNSLPLRMYSEGGNFSDGNVNLMVMGREYGGGGSNSVTHALHVDPDGGLLPVASRAGATATGAVSAAVTATMPTPAAGYFCHVTSIVITKLGQATTAGTAASVIVSTTGLTNNLSWTYGNASTIGVAEEHIYNFAQPLRASAAATAIAVVCPTAGAGYLWRVTMTGYNA